MNMIRNYLESMFAQMPNTSEVRKAKEELGQMMEDKYSELIRQGVSENEAIATVISEFGNLNEIAADLGLDPAIARRNADGDFDITADVANDYMLDANSFALRIGLGVAFFIMCPIMPIIGAEDLMPMGLSLAGMFMMIFGGIFLIVLGSTSFSKWRFLRKDPCFMNMQTYQYVKRESDKVNSNFALRLVLGIMLCAMCWLPMVLLFDDGDMLSKMLGSSDAFAVTTLFLMVGFGVMLIINASMVKGLYESFLRVDERSRRRKEREFRNANASMAAAGPVGGQGRMGGQPGMNGQPGMGGQGGMNGQPGTKGDNGWGRVFVRSYWPIITCIYLVYSMVSGTWASSWLLWPIAAVALPFIIKAFDDK